MFIERKLNNTFLRGIHMSQLLICILSLVFVLGPGSLVTGQETASKEPIEMSVVIMNPSKTKTQSVPIKMYLPTEVKPTDIVNPAGLDVEFDTDQSIYYLFKESVLLKPGETRTYNVEIRDVWVVPQDELNALKEQTKFVVKRFEGNEFYEVAQKLGETIQKSIVTVERTQNDTNVSRRRHIGIYRDNLGIIGQVKENIAMLEKKLMLPKARPIPEILETPEVKTDAPSKTTTWMIIFIIMLFVGMLAGVFFFTWQTQAHFTKNLISSAKNMVFPKRGSSPGEEEDTEGK